MSSRKNRVYFYFQLILLIRRQFTPLLKQNEYILTRTACLGNDVVKTLKLPYKVLNMQKNRVDLLNYQLQDLNNSTIKFHDLKSILKILKTLTFRLQSIKDVSIRSILLHQFDGTWAKRKAPVMIVIDSFSELTDQKFYFPKENTSIFANFNDLDREKIKKAQIEPHGLLHEDRIYPEYFKFFEKINKLWPATQIYFINFPTKFDNRIEFKSRANVIRNSIVKCASKFKNISIIEIDETNIEDRPENELFVYHYSDRVSSFLGIQIQKSII